MLGGDDSVTLSGLDGDGRTTDVNRLTPKGMFGKRRHCCEPFCSPVRIRQRLRPLTWRPSIFSSIQSRIIQIVIDRACVIERLLTVVREENGIAFALEALAQLLRHLLLIFDDQDFASRVSHRLAREDSRVTISAPLDLRGLRRE
jgi:hypothetical protein